MKERLQLVCKVIGSRTNEKVGPATTPTLELTLLLKTLLCELWLWNASAGAVPNVNTKQPIHSLFAQNIVRDLQKG
jgi:hypothetical protein